MNPTVSEQPTPTGAPRPAAEATSREQEVPPELVPEDIYDINDVSIEDGKPVDNIFVEKQYRLLTEPLYSSWRRPEDRPFMALANVGLFYQRGEPPLVPDVMLILDAGFGDPSVKENLSYFIFTTGKPPDVVIEIVSDRRGGEETHKMRTYARIGVPYYVIFDPRDFLGGGELRLFGLHQAAYQPLASHWLSTVELGLTLWPGTFQGMEGRWLRWCDQEGKIVPTGNERAEQEHQRAERFLAQLRAAGIEPAP